MRKNIKRRLYVNLKPVDEIRSPIYPTPSYRNLLLVYMLTIRPPILFVKFTI
jgi:hypothetical protein